MNDSQLPLIAALLMTRNNGSPTATTSTTTATASAEVTQLTATVQTQTAEIAALRQALQAHHEKTTLQYNELNHKLDQIMALLFGTGIVYDPPQPDVPIADTPTLPSADLPMPRTLAREMATAVPVKETVESIGTAVQPIPRINATVSALDETVKGNNTTVNTKLDKLMTAKTTFSSAQLKQIQQVVEAALAASLPKK